MACNASRRHPNRRPPSHGRRRCPQGTALRFGEAWAFIGRDHKNQPPPGHMFAIGIRSAGGLAGVAVIGQPRCRFFDDGHTIELHGIAADGDPIVFLTLLAEIWQIVGSCGCHRLISNVLDPADLAYLHAAGLPPRQRLAPTGETTWEITTTDEQGGRQ